MVFKINKEKYLYIFQAKIWKIQTNERHRTTSTRLCASDQSCLRSSYGKTSGRQRERRRVADPAFRPACKSPPLSLLSVSTWQVVMCSRGWTPPISIPSPWTTPMTRIGTYTHTQ